MVGAHGRGKHHIATQEVRQIQELYNITLIRRLTIQELTTQGLS